MTAETRPTLILASQSPRRAQLLSMLGLDFEVLPADIDESYRPGEWPSAHARRLAEEKALRVAATRPEAVVVGSDTVVVLDDEVLGKPRDPEEALRMLMRLQGREHRVETGIAVVGPTPAGSAPGRRPELRSGVEGVDVRFRAFGDDTARQYIATGEPLDKAGAYGIQGHGATLVERIDGDFFAVMGLPIVRMMALLEEIGWRYNFRGLEPV
ncbi:MAG TPA: nucleoside triphosphate pyrophosphatase [Longimicrobiales bacterium]|nr:nucleoside triphosphate pyrophosphatase [Longimicrobiales bacterium]